MKLLWLCALLAAWAEIVSPALAAPPAFVLSDPALPQAAPAEAQTIAATLAATGYQPVLKNVAQLRAPGVCVPANCALLVLPQAQELPVPLVAPVFHYLQAGGHLLALGVPAWGTPLVEGPDKQWVTADALAASLALTPASHAVFDFGPANALNGWQRSSNRPETPTRMEVAPVSAAGRTASALHVVIPTLDGWDTFLSPPVTTPAFPDGQTMTTLSARGGPRTHSLAVEWDERDGSRWIAVLPLTSEWRRYSVPPEAFRSWANSPAEAAHGFQPENAARLSVGLAFSHTGNVGGAHEYWVANIGTATPAEAPAYPALDAVPALDMLTQAYHFFSMHGPLRLTPDVGVAPAASPLSVQPRPEAAGFAKGRSWRWQALITAADARTEEWRGVPAALTVHAPGGAFGGGVWAAFTPDDPAFYQRASVQALLGQIASRMRDGIYLMEGGANFFTYFSGQSVHLGAEAVNLGLSARQAELHVRVTAPGGSVAWQQTWPVSVVPNALVSASGVWTPTALPAQGDTVTTDLLEDGRVVDTLRHKIFTWTPSPKPDWIEIHPDGHFYQDGRLWRVNGVNYMPSSGIGQDDGTLFEHWLNKAAYDPSVVERDLTHIEALGLNEVSVFLYRDDIDAQNLLDFLRRCRLHHLRVNMSMRPGVSNELQNGDEAAADAAAWDTFRQIIQRYQLAKNDTVFAYEIDWEPDFARYGRQKRTDADWVAWINTKYGGVAQAEHAWGVPVPRDAQGTVTGPSGAQLQSAGGQDVKMIAAYRRFLDDWLAQIYGLPAQRIRALAPHQFVSFRMTGASDPLWSDGGESYQFAGLARAVDFLSPESYGQVGSPNGDLAVQFRIAYGRSVAPHEPILWAETGLSVWGDGADASDLLDRQGAYYARFYQLAEESGADGVIWWWYPGGFRVGENSDFGLINPDGTDRPATAVVRKFGPLFLHAPPPAPPDTWLNYNRDDHPNGAVGVFNALKAPFAAAIAQGHRVGLQAQENP